MSSEQTVFLFIGAIFMVIVMLIWWTWYRLEDNDISGEETGQAEVGPGQTDVGSDQVEVGPGQAEGSPGQYEPPQLGVEIVKEKPNRSLVSSLKKGKATLVGRVQTLLKPPPRENEEKEVTIDTNQEKASTIATDQEKEPNVTDETQDGGVVAQKGGLLSNVRRGAYLMTKKRGSLGAAIEAAELERDPVTSRKRRSSRDGGKKRGNKRSNKPINTEQ